MLGGTFGGESLFQCLQARQTGPRAGSTTVPGLYQADPEQGQGPGKALLEGNEGAPGLASSVKVGQETNGQVPGGTLRLGQVWRAVPGP